MRFGITPLRALIVALATFIMAAASAETVASTLYGAAHAGAGEPSTLYRINSATGAATAVGPIGFDSVGGIDFHPNGALYGVGRRTTGQGVWVLIRIDPNTGVGTEVDALVNTEPSGGGGGHYDVSFRKSDGVLHLTANSPINPCVSLFTVDLATAVATEIGDTAVCSSGNALAFSLDDTLRHANTDGGGTLYTVNQATGASGGPSIGLTYVGFPALTNPRLNAMDFDPGTEIAFVSVNDGSAGSGPNYLATLDPATGTVTHVGLSVNGLDALAWQPSPCVATLYGAAHQGGPGSPSSLYKINASNGVATLVGPIGFDRVGALEFHPVNGVLYGLAERPSDGTRVLIRIDPISGVGSEVGPLVNTLAGGGHFDMSFRHSDNTLFVNAFSPSHNDVGVFTVDVDTGLATEIGPTGNRNPGNALGFSRDDTLHTLDNEGGGRLYSVDQSTGTSSLIASLTYIGFALLVDARPNAWDVGPDDGIPYLGINDGTQGGGPNYLATLDLATGDVFHVGRTVSGLDALAWRTDCTDFNACTDDTCKICDVGNPPCDLNCTLYGSAHAGNNGLATLYEIDALSGAATPVGPIGFERVGAIDFDANGMLYGIGERADGSNRTVLLTIDPLTGAGTEVGPPVITSSGGGHFDISFRNAGGALNLLAFSLSHACISLYQLDRDTGFATEIGDNIVCNSGNGMAYSPGDILFHANKDAGGTLYTVDTFTGASGAPSVPLSYIGFPAMLDPRPNAMEFDPCSGLAYLSVNDSVGGGVVGPNYLGTVDTSTGDVTFIGRSVDGLDGLAIYSTEAVCCHTPLPGAVLYPQNVIATSKTRFEWNAPPENVLMAKGDLSAVSTYGTSSVTPLPMATSFTDGANPSPGDGFYYVLRGECSAGSWSSGGSGECSVPGACLPGGRDGNLP
jgi:hypothetical protein